MPHILLWEQKLGEWERSEKWPVSLKPMTNPGDLEKTLEDKVPPVRFGVRGVTSDSGTQSQGWYPFVIVPGRDITWDLLWD